MINVLVAIMAVIPVVIILICLRMALQRNSRLLALVLGLTAVHESVLVCLPTLASALTDFKPEKDMPAAIDPSELAIVLFGEILFVAAFSATLAVILKKRGRGAWATAFQGNPAQHLTAIILILIGIFLQTDNLVNPSGFSDYAGDLDGTLVRSTSSLVLEWFRVVFWFPSVVVAAVVFVKGRGDRYSRLARAGATIVLFELILVGLTAGVRGRLITTACLVGSLAVFKRRQKILVYMLLATAAFLPISSALPGVVRALSYRVSQDGGNSLEVLKELPALLGAEADQFGTSTFFDDAMWRAQGPRNSAILYRLHDDGSGVGLATFVGALAFPVPRLIWPEKPSAGSADASFMGRAEFLVMRLGYGESDTTMGPFLASAEAYWEAGWIGIIASGVAVALFWYGILTVAARLGGVLSIAIPIMFACSLLIDGIPTALMPLFALIAFVWKALLPTLAVYFAAKWCTVLLNLRRPHLQPGRRITPRYAFVNGPTHGSAPPD